GGSQLFRVAAWVATVALNRRAGCLLVAIFWSVNVIAEPCGMPDGLTVMAESEHGSRAQVVESGDWREVGGTADARDPALAPDGRARIYFNAAGQLVWRSLVSEEMRVLLSNDGEDAFTQAVFGSTPTEIIAVRLID